MQQVKQFAVMLVFLYLFCGFCCYEELRLDQELGHLTEHLTGVALGTLAAHANVSIKL